jgi:hypothetical protein
MRPYAPWVLASSLACAGTTGSAPPGASSSTGADDGPASSDADSSPIDTSSCAVCSESSGGATTSTTTTSSGTTAAAPVFDVGVMPDAPPAERCVQCEIALMTTQSNAMHTLVGMPLFLEAELDAHLVFGLAQADAGRVAFSGDANVLYREGTCPLWPWLGATGVVEPRVLCIGADWPCHGETGPPNPPLEINALTMYPGTLDYGGFQLPPEYADDPVLLRADYDLVVYIAVRDYATDGMWSFEASQVETLEAYVRDAGGGLYLAGEYWGAMMQVHIDSLNAFAAPFAVEFEQLSLDWGPAGAMVEIDCFPEPAG